MRLGDSASGGATGMHDAPDGAFESILYRTRSEFSAALPVEPGVLHDLHLDQVVAAIVAGRERYDLIPFFHRPLGEVDAVHYRQEVMRDLEVPGVREAVRAFSDRMLEVHRRLAQSEKLRHPRQKERWHLGAAEVYCETVEDLRRALVEQPLDARGMKAFRGYVAAYADSPTFRDLASEARAASSALGAVRYDLFLSGSSVSVRPHAGQPDYSAEVAATFQRFRRSTTQDYRSKFTVWPDVSQLEGEILDRVARLNAGAFGALRAFWATHSAFVEERIARFEREVQFYLAVLDHVEKLRRSGLDFCYPAVSASSKEVLSRNGFDLALAARLVADRKPVVRNDFEMDGRERIFVISGPNQGGKTTFARTFGQIHYLACLGCPVAGTEACTFLFDRLFTHFEREEAVDTLRGKLQDELLRMRDILDVATSRSVIVVNEVFSSTTIGDALFLGREIMGALSRLDLLAVCVTFLVELASFDDKTVSLVSTVDPADPAIRTFKVVRRAADGLAYALAIAEKHAVTHAQLLERIPA